jgi:WD40 repeat protein
MSVDWKPDGKQLVTGGADNVLKVWDAESGEQVRTSRPAGKQVAAVRWVPGKDLVAGACGDKVVRTWNPANGGIQGTYSGPSDYVFGVATSRDGSRVAAGGADGALFVWDGPSTKVLRKLEPPAPAEGGKGSKSETSRRARQVLVPTVPRGNAVSAAPRPSPDRPTRSVKDGIPTQSVGTSENQSN